MSSWIWTLSGAVNLDRVSQLRIEPSGGNAEWYRVVADGVIIDSGLTKVDALDLIGRIANPVSLRGRGGEWNTSQLET